MLCKLSHWEKKHNLLGNTAFPVTLSVAVTLETQSASCIYSKKEKPTIASFCQEILYILYTPSETLQPALQELLNPTQKKNYINLEGYKMGSLLLSQMSLLLPIQSVPH